MFALFFILWHFAITSILQKLIDPVYSLAKTPCRVLFYSQRWILSIGLLYTFPRFDKKNRKNILKLHCSQTKKTAEQFYNFTLLLNYKIGTLFVSKTMSNSETKMQIFFSSLRTLETTETWTIYLQARVTWRKIKNAIVSWMDFVLRRWPILCSAQSLKLKLTIFFLLSSPLHRFELARQYSITQIWGRERHKFDVISQARKRKEKKFFGSVESSTSFLSRRNV